MRSSLEGRRKTFCGRWSRFKPSGDDLARSGFYLADEPDSVPECAFCRGKITIWPVDEHPFDVHGRLFPGCSFVLAPPSYVISYDECGTGKPREASVQRTIAFPSMTSASSRRVTFDSWRGKVSRESLVEAGFFATGQRDAVKCFNCGVGLENWLEGDQPWEEHAKVSPNCELIRCRGRRPVERQLWAGNPGLGKTPPELERKTPLLPVEVALLSHQESRQQRVSPSKLRSSSEGRPRGVTKATAGESPCLPQTICIACQKAHRDSVIVPCGHFVLCHCCASGMSTCPVCGTKILQLIKPMLS